MNYTELKASVTNWAARSDAAVVAEVPNFILFATGMFNHGQDGYAPALRVREMETTATLTPVSEAYALPADYLQYITVGEDASIYRSLRYVSSSYSDYRYADRSGGLSEDFIISGSNIYSFPVSENDLTLTYYAKIPDLSDAAPSNWLLAKQPQLYLHGALFQLSIFSKDNDLFSRSAAMVKTLIDGLMAEELMSKYSRARVRPAFQTP